MWLIKKQTGDPVDAHPYCNTTPSDNEARQSRDFNHSHSVMGSLPAGTVHTQMEVKPPFAKLSLAFFPIATL